MKKQPQRTCMGCNEKKAKNDLIRIVKNKNDEINIVSQFGICCFELFYD